MNILLAYPYFLYDRAHEENVQAMPLGLFYLAAVLIEAGHDVRVAGLHDMRGDEQGLQNVIEHCRPDVLAVSVFHANRWGGIDLARITREIAPECKIIFGGIGATALDEFLLQHYDCIDFIIRGEGEHTLTELLQCLENSGDPANVAGLTYRNRDGILRTPDRELIQDLDSLPNPADYFPYHHVALSRGCPGRCSFCGSPEFWRNAVRFHSAGWFVEQLKALRQRGVRFFYFSDDTFTLQKDRVLEVCRRIRKELPDITWAAISRVDRVDEEMLKAMRTAGCIQLSFGVESGSERIRKTLNKKTSHEAITRAFDLTRRYGILPRAYIIYGNPGETEEDIQANIDILAEIQPLVTLFHLLTVFPGTQLWERAKAEFDLSDEVWLERNEDLLYYEIDTNLNEESVREWGLRMKREYYAMLPQIARDIELADDPDLAPFHADFLSRLAMTFDYGDYADHKVIPEHKEVAEDLYVRAMEYAPDPRAHWGLGTRRLQQGNFEEGMNLLITGADTFPKDEQLGLTLSSALMQAGRFRDALERLQNFEESQNALPYLIRCSEELGREDLKAKYSARYQGY